MTTWTRGARLNQATFAARFFGRGADDPVVRSLHGAVRGAATATSHEDIREAAGKLADAIKAVGVSQWPRFVADAAERARDPAAVAAADKSGQPAVERMQSVEDRMDKTAPVPFLDRAGQAILNKYGKPMMRPAGLPPEMFVSPGLRDKEIEKALIASGSEGGGAAELGYQAGVLRNFKRGGPGDAQRLGGSFHEEFVDYATVAIGLYAAANGMTRREILNIQDLVARGSRYRSEEEKDSVYTHLPTRNIWNTDLGYSLYQSGRIGVTVP